MKFLKNQTRTASQRGFSNPRVLLAFALSAVASLLAMLSFAAPLSTTPYQRPGRTERVFDGGPGNTGSYPSVSSDARYIAFYSSAPNLVAGDTNGAFDVFVRDMKTGTIERVSVASDGTQGNGDSVWPSISADGRYVAFHSHASNLVPGDTNQTWDVFVHDRQAGITERMSVASGGAEVFGISLSPSISADGRYVAFHSGAPNLVPDDPIEGSYDVFVHDRITGTTERVSVGASGAQPDSDSYHPSISGDGRYVAFYSFASNLVPGDTNGQPDVFVRDRVAGTTEWVSVGTDGAQGNSDSDWPAISADGRYVVFYSAASNFVPWDTNGSYDVFVRDRETGTTERVSVGSDGVEGNRGSSWSAISNDGRYVGFQSVATNLVPGDTNGNGVDDVFVRDRETAATERVSVGADGTQGNSRSDYPFMNADGRYVAFWSFASNFVPGDNNGIPDVFVRDRGRPLDVGDLSVVIQGNQVSVSGWATFSGAVVTSVTDPSGDGNFQGQDVGADLVGASLTYRPENGDLLVRLRLASLPKFAGGGGYPGVLYGLRFVFGGAHYEVRALTAEVTGGTPSANPSFALYRCDSSCTQQATLSGGLGTTGFEVLASIPLSVLGAQEGSALTGIEAFTAIGEAAPGSLQTLDQANLPDATIPVRQVSLGIASKGTPVGDVVFNGTAALTNGNFSGILDTGSLAPGNYDVWARACLGTTCGAAVSWPPPVQLLGIASRKVHGSAGTFDIDLPITGARGIECRSGGASGDYTLVFSFANPLTSVGSASVASGTGSVASNSIDSNDAHNFIVNLTGVTNAQVITVSLSDVSDSAGDSSSILSASMGVLVGDTTANGSVNSSDISQTKAQSGNAATSSNFREDVTVSGLINSSDISLVKSKSGTALP